MDVPGIPELTFLSSSGFSLVPGGEQAAHPKEPGRGSELRAYLVSTAPKSIKICLTPATHLAGEDGSPRRAVSDRLRNGDADPLQVLLNMGQDSERAG